MLSFDDDFTAVPSKAKAPPAPAPACPTTSGGVLAREPVHDLDAEQQALVDYVASLGPGPDIPQVTSGGDVGRGRELYTANCAACHGASGSGNAVGGGSAAASLGHATGLDVAEAMLIGPGVMPPFAFDPADRDAIVAYVQFLRGAPSPGGFEIGGFGPVSEGFVSIVVGLILVVLAVRFVGRRSHRGEPAADPPVDIEPPSGAHT